MCRLSWLHNKVTHRQTDKSESRFERRFHHHRIASLNNVLNDVFDLTFLAKPKARGAYREENLRAFIVALSSGWEASASNEKELLRGDDDKRATQKNYHKLNLCTYWQIPPLRAEQAEIYVRHVRTATYGIFFICVML